MQKKRIAEMYPVKKYLSISEACSYMDMSPETFKGLNLSVAAINGKNYYRVAELDALFENSIIIHQTK